MVETFQNTKKSVMSLVFVNLYREFEDTLAFVWSEAHWSNWRPCVTFPGHSVIRDGWGSVILSSWGFSQTSPKSYSHRSRLVSHPAPGLCCGRGNPEENMGYLTWRKWPNCTMLHPEQTGCSGAFGCLCSVKSASQEISSWTYPTPSTGREWNPVVLGQTRRTDISRTWWDILHGETFGASAHHTSTKINRLHFNGTMSPSRLYVVAWEKINKHTVTFSSGPQDAEKQCAACKSFLYQTYFKYQANQLAKKTL